MRKIISRGANTVEETESLSENTRLSDEQQRVKLTNSYTPTGSEKHRSSEQQAPYGLPNRLPVGRDDTLFTYRLMDSPNLAIICSEYILTYREIHDKNWFYRNINDVVYTCLIPYLLNNCNLHESTFVHRNFPY